MMAGISFSSITAYENLNAEADYKGNERIFANVTFMVALYIVLLILFTTMLKSALGGSSMPSLDSLNNLFNN